MSGVQTTFHVDASEKKIYAVRSQDVEAILEHNKQIQNIDQKWAGEWHHIGTIPNVIIEKWMNDEGCNLLAMTGDEFDLFVKKKLRSSEWAWLRTTNRKF